MSTDLHPQYCPSQALLSGAPRSPSVAPGDSFLKMMPMKKRGEIPQKQGLMVFQKLKQYRGLAINELLPKNSIQLKLYPF